MRVKEILDWYEKSVKKIFKYKVIFVVGVRGERLWNLMVKENIKVGYYCGNNYKELADYRRASLVC